MGIAHRPLISNISTSDRSLTKGRSLVDSERDRYLVLHSAWRKEWRIYGCAIHLDLIEGKVWIQHNSTEIDVFQELAKLGIPPKDLVLGFRSPIVRQRLAEAMSQAR